MVAFEIGEESEHYCRHMWKFAFGFTVAELKNRLGAVNTNSNRKHVDNAAALRTELVIPVLVTKWKGAICGEELANSGA